MSVPATFLLKLRDDGTIRVMRSNGDDCTEADVELMRIAIRKEIRVRNLEAATTEREEQRKAAYGDNPPKKGKRFEVDPLLVFLEEERKRRNLARTAVAQAMFIDSPKLTSYLYGSSRPSLETVRIWYYVMGFALMGIPHALVGQIKEMVDKHLAEDSANREAEVA